MRDPEDYDFVCPHRICHARQTGDAHTIVNLRSRVNILEKALKEEQEKSARIMNAALDSVIRSL